MCAQVLFRLVIGQYNGLSIEHTFNQISNYNKPV